MYKKEPTLYKEIYKCQGNINVFGQVSRDKNNFTERRIASVLFLRQIVVLAIWFYKNQAVFGFNISFITKIFQLFYVYSVNVKMRIYFHNYSLDFNGSRSTAFCMVLFIICAEHPIPKNGTILSFSLIKRLLRAFLEGPPKFVFVLSAKSAIILDFRLYF